jgi:hypothetical protein
VIKQLFQKKAEKGVKECGWFSCHKNFQTTEILGNKQTQASVKK